MITLPEWIYFETHYNEEQENYLIIFKAKFGNTIRLRGKQEQEIYLISKENELQEDLKKTVFFINLENGVL